MIREYHFGDEKRRSIDCTVDVDLADGWDGSSIGRNGDLNRARRWDAAVTMLSELHPFGFTILVYEPPATGSPWLVVCVRPPTDIVGVENYLTAEDAHQRVAELSHEFVSRVAQGR